MRDHRLYFGQTSPIFTVLGRFDLQPARLDFSFETWPSVEDFDSGAAPYRPFSKRFELDRDGKFPYAELTSQVEQRALEIIGLGGRGWKVEMLRINTIDKALVISASHPSEKHRRNEDFGGEAYDEVIASNLELVAMVMQTAWTHAKLNDPFLAAMTAAT